MNDRIEALNREREAEQKAIQKQLNKGWPKSGRRTINVGRANFKRASALASMTVGKPTVDRYVQMLIENDWDVWAYDHSERHDLTKEWPV